MLALTLIACTRALPPKTDRNVAQHRTGATAPTTASGRGPFDVWRPLQGAFQAVAVDRVRGLGCALSKDGRIACWGEEVGRRPDAAHFTGTASPHVWHGVGDAIAIAVNQGELCAARRSGKVSCVSPQVVVDAGPTDHALDVVQLVRAHNGFCGRTKAGGVVCWGWVEFVDTGPKSKLARIDGITSARELACGHDLCCAISRSGELDCFGNDHERLGKLAGHRARRILPGVRFESIAIEGRQLCGIETSGRIHCVDPKRTPALFSGRRDARWLGGSLESGIGSACLLTRAGEIVCDDGENIASVLSGVTQVRIDERSGCALRGDQIWCWGDNANGGNGDGSSVSRALPARVARVENATAIAAGAMSSCALTGGYPRCWGFGIDGTYSFSATPTELSRRVERFARSQYLAYAGITPEGEIWQHSRGRTTTVAGGGPAQAVSIDRAGNLCAADAAGAVSCLFSLGEDGRDDRWRPIEGATGIVELAPSSSGFCGRTRAGGVLCMQDDRFENDDDFVDAPSKPMVARPVEGLTGVEQLAAGQGHYCARLADRDVKCWGHFYLRGFLQEWRSKLPTSIPEFRGASDIAANHFHTCAVVGQSVRCWGENDHGQLGDGTFTPRRRPVAVKLPSGVVPKAVAVGNRHSCLLDAAGSVYCWGDNSRGLLGDGRDLDTQKPARVVLIGVD